MLLKAAPSWPISSFDSYTRISPSAGSSAPIFPMLCERSTSGLAKRCPQYQLAGSSSTSTITVIRPARLAMPKKRGRKALLE